MHYLEHIFCSSTKSLVLHIRWNNARLIVRSKLSSPATSVQPMANSFIEQYNSTCDAGDCEEAEAIVSELLGAIVETGSPIFDHLAPPPPSAAATSSDLHTLLFPEQFFFRLRGLRGNANLIYDVKYARENIVVYSPFSVCQLSIDKSCGLPRYSTTDIRVLENLANNFNVALVTVDGQSMCSKTRNVHCEDAAQRELDCLWKITTSYSGTSLRVPKLLGLIEVPDGKKVVGFLEEYIPVSDSWELSTLGSIQVVLGVDEARRKKWASQVQETVWLLHQIGIVWGGGNASNVLIHSDSDDAWVIDFGGERIGSWLDLKEAPTVEGDELAVKKIFEFLEV